MPLIASIPEFGIDRTSDIPLAVQLAEQIRQAVLTGRLKPESRLPSTRAFAEELGVSRATALAAYDQLIAEGYLEGKHGSGTRIAAQLPEVTLKTGPAATFKTAKIITKTARLPQPFQQGVFDSDHFPHAEWGKLLGRIWRNPDTSLLNGHDPFGYLPLRAALARHLHEWRGMAVDPAQILITGGSTDAFSLLREAMFAPGDKIWMEEPGYSPARNILGGQGIDVISVPVDGNGLDVTAGRQAAMHARAAFVTPARHHPTGVTMPLARRLDLIAWARESDAFIIEDDYDSEHRYIGQPLPALMSLDRDRILYIGSFSKVFSPVLRLGFLIVPPQLTDKFRTLRQELLPPPSLLAQPTLAQFIETGAFAQHIRRMRRLYASRRNKLIAALSPGEPALFRIEAPPAGLTLLLALSDNQNDVALVEKLAESGINVQPLSPLYRFFLPRQGLLLGFSGFDEAHLEKSATALIKVLESSI
ncbi:GntR family transcriptional regulator [Ochrobactrum sp. P6BS-III]|uniref:MocR-like pyridoxine biosynthesis transcription factor PdxR n=1 Tax=unclassified Ochrobactrum TaxID=239106 RepID=UPI0009943828|nr:GntR family transcriptional regulator/MocR family aminotransferase [Ochrobactrum sp. P6BSIII]OOL20682.1 GntR family transcriptional regulator [Ochrobactrum sp. P6BS-III]